MRKAAVIRIVSAMVILPLCDLRLSPILGSTGIKHDRKIPSGSANFARKGLGHLREIQAKLRGRSADIAMKPTNPEHDHQLDELAAGLDAGWDTPAPAATQASSSQPPLSIPPGSEALDALDADWDTADVDSASLPGPTAAR